MTIAITIITPTYNRAQMLEKVIKSISAQTFQNFEHLIIDDGSSDGTKETVLNLIKTKKHSKYLFKENGGEASAVNLGWQKAKGKYVIIINSDDPQPPELLQTIVNFMENNPGISVGYPDWTCIDKDSNPIRKVIVPEYSFEQIFLFIKCLPGPGAIIRKKDFQNIHNLRDPRFPLVSDLGCWLTLGATGKKFSRIPHNVAVWRSHDQGATIAYKGAIIANDIYRLYDFFWNNIAPKPLLIYKRKSMARVGFICGTNLKVKEGGLLTLLNYWTKGFFWHPLYFVSIFWNHLIRYFRAK